jgi:hypothetical protein
LQDLCLKFSLNTRATGSPVPPKSLSCSHAVFMPDAAQPINRFSAELVTVPSQYTAFDII